MLSQQFQESYARISDIGKNLYLFLQEYRQGKLTEGDDTKSLQSIEDIIVHALAALKDQRYEVAVVAPMKAGKSTFLNAIIGAEVLASESAACTICRTDVCHIDSKEVPSLLEYRENLKQPIVIERGGAVEIHQSFLERTHQIRENTSADKETPFRFELRHPIEAIKDLPSLRGFTLVDTPGPNEWKSMSVDTVALKQAALEALRTCKAVLFILNYRSFKDNAVNELFKSITENRQELLSESQGRIYFILNQVDLRSEKDPEIAETIKFLQQELIRFGFPEPVIYPTSALQGLLAKLIQQGQATENQIKDFKKFFSARYAQENEDGDLITPAPQKIASKAIQDSGILAVQEAVFQTVVQASGWNLLSDVLNQLDKAARLTESVLNSQISGWEMEINVLRTKIEEYKNRAIKAEEKIDSVKRGVDNQKEILLEGFSAGLDAFAEGAKERIQEELDRIAESQSMESKKKQIEHPQNSTTMLNDDIWRRFFQIGLEIGSELLESVPVIGKQLARVFRVGAPLLDSLKSDVPGAFSYNTYDSRSEFDPYIIRCKDLVEAQRVVSIINSFCAPHIQGWWVDTQDRLIREGTRIREELVKKIQEDIQLISDELSAYLGDALQVEINVNPIQFPEFEFSGIDAQIQHQQEVYRRTHREQRTRSRFCCSDETYYVDVPIEEKRSIYQISLRLVGGQINTKIDEQVGNNKDLLKRVIEKQVNKDFRNAEMQILNYVNSFQSLLDRLLEERDRRQEEAPRIIESLKSFNLKLSEHLSVLNDARASLDEWKPS